MKMGRYHGSGTQPRGDTCSVDKHSREKCVLTTGGGAQQSADSLAFAGSELLEGEEVYILKECPPAQSIGKTVMDKGYMFIWDPREQVPYLIPPSIVPKCRLRVPRKHRICASRVVECSPV